ncbi:MAG: SufD family Fe-S cluster assembly protein [Erysipelotrichaceae bacterium]|nr:SufD family Fe-S cluster assembly protein [Erysipelotrichaceae bacterium]MDY5251363.1 SufD family Fe-S cluster assembly protein [Erysipelotrichaceae bacterium]
MFKLQNECENIVINEEYLELEVDVDGHLDLNISNKKDCSVFVRVKKACSIYVSVEVKEHTHCTYLIYNDNDAPLQTKEVFKVKENAILDLAVCDINQQKCSRDIKVDLIEEYATCNFKSAVLSNTEMKYQIALTSYSANTQGKMENYGVVLENGKYYIDAIGKIEKGASGSKSHQASHALCFASKQQATILPQLLIDENDVEASHATTVGSIDEAQLFYMQSRGLKTEEVGALVTMGYLSFIKDVISNEKLQAYLSEEIESKVKAIC